MIDIIVPIYNTPLQDLQACLSSIINQTYCNYTVYLIDDGSNDETKEYLDNFSKKNNKFIVKHIENKGVSHARNVGLETSNSTYVVFVDSDDTLEPGFLSDALSIMTDNDLDLVIGGYNEINNGAVTRVRKSLDGLHIYDVDKIIPFMEKLLSGKTNEHNIEIGDAPTGRIYTRMFKRSAIGSLRFNEGIRMSEDTLFMIDICYQIKRIGVTNRIWYNYYKNDYSISNGTDKEKLIGYINDFILEIDKRLQNESNQRIRDAYQKRIDKATSYIIELQNKSR